MLNIALCASALCAEHLTTVDEYELVTAALTFPDSDQVSIGPELDDLAHYELPSYTLIVWPFSTPKYSTVSAGRRMLLAVAVAPFRSI